MEKGMAKVVHIRDGTHDVRIDRGTCWGNPYVIGRDGSRAQVIEKYRRRLWARVRANRELAIEKLSELHGKRLGCWCAPRQCHGHILARAAAWAAAQKGG